MEMLVNIRSMHEDNKLHTQIDDYLISSKLIVIPIIYDLFYFTE